MKTHTKKTLGFFHLTRPIFISKYSYTCHTDSINDAISVDCISDNLLNHFINKGYDVLNIKMYGDK